MGVRMDKIHSDPADVPTAVIPAVGSAAGEAVYGRQPDAGQAHGALYRVDPPRDLTPRRAAVPMPIEAEASLAVRGGQGGAKYGPPQDEFVKIARAWSAILGVSVTPQQVALCEVSSRVSRLAIDPGNHAAMVDAVGYFICLQRVVEGD